MRRTLHLAMLCITTTVSAQAPKPAHSLVESAIHAMGGAELLRSLGSVRLDGMQHEYLLGNAERAEGPWRTTYSRFSELRDLDGNRLRRTEVNAAVAPGTPGAVERATIFSDSVLVVRANGRENSGGPAALEDMIDRLASAPDRALLLAAGSAQLKWERQVTRHGVVHDVLAFPFRGGRMRVELARDSHLPTAVEITRTYPDDFRRAPFGDVTLRVNYDAWTLDPNRLWWPRQARYALNGELLRDVTFTALTQRAELAADSFAVTDSGRTLFATSRNQTPARFKVGDRGTLPDIAEGIVRYRDFWATTAVRQDDGIVIFEAHISPLFLKGVIADAEKRWPGLKVKAIVMTSDPWAHLGGVRAAVALGLPIYVNPGSIPFLTALTKAPFTLDPDDLARTARTPKFIPVATRAVIGTGTNRIELYPVGGAYGERMTMAYFPARKLLYGSDLVFPSRAPAPGAAAPAGFTREPAADLRAAVAREKLVVDTVFCVQPTIPPVAWRDFLPAGMKP